MIINDINIANIRRTRRKTVSIKINSNADVMVNAPTFMSNNELHKILISKYEWIKKTRNKILTSARPYKHKYEEGEIFYFLGNKFKLKYNNNSQIALDEENRLIDMDPNCDKAFVIKQFYKKLSKHYLLKIAYDVSKRLKIFPKEYKISSAEKRWGSCSASGNINLSYKLLLCPEKFIEYVIIHELAHLKEHNHSKNFWDYVEKLMPDYKTQLEWIKENQNKLTL
jgi:predicted metal-dependent hydrolase